MRKSFCIPIPNIEKSKGDPCMHCLQKAIVEYLTYNQLQKRLDSKTIRAYTIDLNQFLHQLHPLPLKR